METTGSYEQILAVLQAVSEGDTKSRVALPDNSNEQIIQLAKALNRLLDKHTAQIDQLERNLEERSLQLKKSDDKFARAFRSSPAGIAIAALPEGRWIEVNEALGKMTGYTREEMLGRTSAELNLVDATARAKMIQAIQEVGMIHNVEIQVITKNQERRDVLVSVEQIELDGQPCAITIQYDITEHKQLDATMMELAMERTQANMFQRFVGGVSHDLRTRLSTIKSSLYLLKKHATEQTTRYLNNLEIGTSQIERIVEDMIYLSALDKELVLNFQPCELGHLIKELLEESQAAALKKRQSLSFDETLASIPLIVDKQAIQQTLKHLISNAISYTAPEGHIRIYSYKSDNKIVVAIADDGIGIGAEDLPQIFERFYRADKARSTHTGGTGIGLSICKKIVERHGGRIWAESTPERGSTFYFSLPLDLSLENQES